MACEIAADQLVSDILWRFEDKELRSVADPHIRRVLNRRSVSLGEKQEETLRWLKWVRSKNHLKVTSSPVPIGVIPEGARAELHDVRVFTKGRPDDAIYDGDKEIREKVARGNCVLERLDGPEAGCTVLVFALKKFTGGLGDDDDREDGDDLIWKRYFTKSLEEAQKVIATRKANGEAGHFGVRKIGGDFVLCGGSKNVHLLFRSKDDIERYTDQRYTVAREVSEAILESMEGIDKEQRLQLYEFMATTELTAIFEILNPTHQHVEDLSYLTKSELQFICWTSSELEPKGHGLCCMPPHVGIEIARGFGLKSVDYETIPSSDVNQRMSEVRHGYNYEGEVFYFLDEKDEVIGLLKKKTAWYILCRAIREKCRAAAQNSQKSPDSFSINQTIRKTEERIGQIKQWLSLEEETTQAWKDLGVKFLRWVIHNLDQRNISLTDVADMFPVTWKRFLKETGETDKIPSANM